MAWILLLIHLGLIFTEGVTAISPPTTNVTTPSPTKDMSTTTLPENSTALGPPATNVTTPSSTNEMSTTSLPENSTASGPPTITVPIPTKVKTTSLPEQNTGSSTTTTPIPSPTKVKTTPLPEQNTGPSTTTTPIPSPTKVNTTHLAEQNTSPSTTTTSIPSPTKKVDTTFLPKQSSTAPGPPTATKRTSPQTITEALPSTSHSTTTTTKTVVTSAYYMSFHITNKGFNSSLEDSSSPYYKEMKATIGTMYNNVYNCTDCRFGYTGFIIISFSQGSVVARSKLFFEGTHIKSEGQVEKLLRGANKTSMAGLELSQLKVSTNPITTSSEAGVPDWAIALLVLVAILVFFLLLALLWLLIYYCRRKHRGSMELLSSRDSYHPMNEYPTYQTHSRFVAPSNKQNPYDEGNPKNGTRPFSYTNPTMANDEL